MNFNDLFLRHAAASYDKQMALGDIIGDADWQFDMNTQSLTFGGKTRFKIQVIGTESYSSNTWLWGWANEASGIPAPMLRAAEELRTFGKQNNLGELTEPGFPLTDQINGHVLSMIASGVCNGDAYYRGPYDSGALFMLIRDDHFPHRTVNSALRVSTIFPQLIANIPISNHRLAFRHYLQFYLAKIKEEPDKITAQFNDKNLVQARFLPDNRLDSIKSKLQGN